MSVYKRPSGCWQATYRNPSTGRRVSKTFRTKAQAVAWERDALAAIDAGEYVPPNRVTVAEAADAWLADVERTGKLRPSTLAAYRQDVRLYVKPTLGRVTLADLTTGMIEARMVGAMAADGRSPATIRRSVVPLSRALRRAVRHGQLRMNPASEIAWDEALPEREERLKPTFTEHELRRLVDAAPNEQAGAVLGLMAGTGLRIGEALALRRSDLGERSVTVAGTMHADGSIGRPKTDAGEQVVPVLPEYLEYLNAARLLAAGREQEAPVFTDRRGEPHHRSSVQRRWLHAAQDAAGLPRTGFHAIRRSYALALAERGVSPLDARDLMGHSTVAMTADVYQREGTAEATLERLLRAVEDDSEAHRRGDDSGRARGPLGARLARSTSSSACSMPSTARRHRTRRGARPSATASVPLSAGRGRQSAYLVGMRVRRSVDVDARCPLREIALEDRSATFVGRGTDCDGGADRRADCSLAGREPQQITWTRNVSRSRGLGTARPRARPHRRR